MPLEVRLLTGLALAVAVAYTATPAAIRMAAHLDFYDQPRGYKGHGRPTPYLGGSAVTAAFVVAVVALTGDWGRTLPLLSGVIVLWAVGTTDDRITVSPGIRVAIEAALALVLWRAGMGWDLGAGGALDAAVTVGWIVGVVNAFNLFDNMDGAASSMAAVIAAAVSLLGLVHTDVWLTVAGAALCGACAGFLPYNLSRPSRIFLGDGGSMPVGFAAAGLVMAGSAGAAPAWQSLAIGLLFVGIPALDTALVIVSRRRRGISVLTGGRDHLTHRTRKLVRDARAVAVTLGAAQALVSAVALVGVNGSSGLVVAAVMVYLVGASVAIGVLDAGFAAESGSIGAGETVTLAPAEVRAARLRRVGLHSALLALAGIALGLTPLASGLYDSATWAPVGLALVGVTAAGLIANPPRMSGPAWLTVAGLALVALVALTSSLWAGSIEQAVREGDRLLLYLAWLTALLMLVRSDRAGTWLLGAFTAAALALAVVTLIRMTGADGPRLFVAGRLDGPLGYINGQASFHLLAFWGCIAASEHRRSSWLAGAGTAGATALACLLVLSQSRGVGVAAAVSAIVVMVALPGRARRGWALVVPVTATGAILPVLLDVYREGATARHTHVVAVVVAIAALCAGTIWGLATAKARGSRADRLRPVAVTGLIVLALAAVGLGTAHQGTLRSTLHTQYRAFVRLGIEPQGSALSGGSASSRLVSGAGTRYDYWRIAWGVFREHPLRGVGAGGYPQLYFERRATTEDVRQPHSVELQTLSELGLAGALGLALALIGAGWGAVRIASRVPVSEDARFLAVAAVGMATAWLVHTSVDWIHLLPGLTAVALAGVAVLVRSGAQSAPPVSSRRGTDPRRLAAAVAVALLLAVAGTSLARQTLAEHYLRAAQVALAGDPAQALTDADRALRVQPELLGAWFAKAAALARFNQAGAAEATLREATRREPGNFVAWALLGDLAVRRGRLDGARRAYRRSSELNPRDPALSALAADPGRAGATLSQTGPAATSGG